MADAWERKINQAWKKFTTQTQIQANDGKYPKAVESNSERSKVLNTDSEVCIVYCELHISLLKLGICVSNLEKNGFEFDTKNSIVNIQTRKNSKNDLFRKTHFFPNLTNSFVFFLKFSNISLAKYNIYNFQPL